MNKCSICEAATTNVAVVCRDKCVPKITAIPWAFLAAMALAAVLLVALVVESEAAADNSRGWTACVDSVLASDKREREFAERERLLPVIPVSVLVCDGPAMAEFAPPPSRRVVTRCAP
jgi:hypothetical protein